MSQPTIEIVFVKVSDGPELEFVEVERDGKSVKIGEWMQRAGPYCALVIPDPEAPPPQRTMESQGAEFDAAAEFATQVRRLQLTPVVDDDYLEIRHDYEGAVRGLLKAFRENGRQWPTD